MKFDNKDIQKIANAIFHLGYTADDFYTVHCPCEDGTCTSEIVWNIKDHPTKDEILAAVDQVPINKDPKRAELKRAHDAEIEARYSATDIALIMNGVGYTEQDKQELLDFIAQMKEKLNQKYAELDAASTEEAVNAITW